MAGLFVHALLLKAASGAENLPPPRFVPYDDAAAPHPYRRVREKRREGVALRVVVVGSGAAGLGAAHRLRSAGFSDVVVVEAAGRTGGRAWRDADFADFPLDLGASYVPAAFAEELEWLTGDDALPLRAVPGTHTYMRYVWVNYTYWDLLNDHFAPPRDSIELDCVVGRIAHGRKRGMDPVEVACRDGRTFAADRAIVTVPLSVLKAGDIDFDPGLPLYLQDTIQDGRPFWGGFKIFLEFDEYFYQDVAWFCINHKCEGKTGENLIWDYSRFSSPNPDAAPNMLAAYYVGDRADKFDGLSELETVERVLEDIAGYFNRTVETLRYRRHLLVNWSKEPYIRGTYSGYPEISRDDWVTGVGGVLYFAGEAFTVNGEQQGWVYSALHSGFAAADMVLGLRDGWQPKSKSLHNKVSIEAAIRRVAFSVVLLPLVDACIDLTLS